MFRISIGAFQRADAAIFRPFQRLVHCSRLPNAGELLRADFESTFKGPLSEAEDTAQYLHKYCVKADEVVPYTTTMMRVFTDLGALEDMRLIFAMAINELHHSVPEELYRIYLFSISETDTFTRDEVLNVLSLAQNTGIKLGIISKLCILDLMLKLGLDPINHVVAIAEEYSGPLPQEDIELLLKKCDSLFSTVLLTHYNAHWATEMFSLCSRFQISVAERIVGQLFKMCLNEPSVHPIHLIRATLIILNNRKSSALKLSEEDLLRCVLRCKQWRSLEAINTLQKVCDIHAIHSEDLSQAFAVVTMNILSDVGRIPDAITLFPLLTTTNAAYSPYPCFSKSNGVTLADTHPAYFLSQSLAQLGAKEIDAAYYAIAKLAETDKTMLTTEMMDVVLAACSAIKDEVRALETFNVYANFELKHSADSFLHVMQAMGTHSAVHWHRPAMAMMLAEGITPSTELLRLMLSQCLECDDIEATLWVVKLNRIFKKTIDRMLAVKLCAKIVSAQDTEAASFFVKVLGETETHVDNRVIQSFKNSFGI